MKTQIQKITYLTFVFLLIAFFGCENKRGPIETALKENVELKESYQVQLLETRQAVKEADSLKTVVFKLQDQVKKLAGEVPAATVLNKDEEAVKALVNKLHHGWASMVNTKNTSDLLQYFLPNYTTNAVRINTENIPSVQRSNNTNFEDHLKELISANNISITFGQTHFLSIEVKDDIFVTTYKTQLRVYSNNKQVYTSSLVTLLSGANRDGWKVGNYSWVTLNYD